MTGQPKLDEEFEHDPYCVCGHVEDEHQSRGDDPGAPASVRCGIEDCECLGFEES